MLDVLFVSRLLEEGERMALTFIVIAGLAIVLGVLIYYTADYVGHFANKIINFFKDEENER